MKALVALLLLNISLSVYCQDNTLKRGPEKGHPVLIIRGIISSPIDTATEWLDLNKRLCPDHANFYILDGLVITEDNFEGGKLSDCVNEEGKYALQFRDSDTTKCVEAVRFFLNINVPVVVNGSEIDPLKSKDLLSAIKPEDLVSIQKRKTWFLGSTFLDIQTKQLK